MKDAQGSVSTTTNIASGSAVEMTIHSGAIGKLMSMFSNQYSDAALAVVREYFCNGDDARIAAGSDRPTEVFLPTDLNPEILVRDFGIGLDREGLVNTFATYGLSTKDDSNDQTGGFGIGSKAAFTLGQQFTVTGFKDGVKTVVNFALNAKGIGEVDVRFEGPTEEPNGVLVAVGVPNVANMRSAAERFFLTVPKGRALVDGKAPAHLSDTVEFTRFNDEVMIVKDGLGLVRLQMGPVVYRVSRSILESVASRLDGLPSQAVAFSLANWGEDDSVLMEVAMGDVNIAPSREDLRDTDATVNRIAAIVQGISDYVVNDVQAKIDAAPSRYAAHRIMHSALETLKGFKVSKKAFTYNGMEDAFKNDVKVQHPTLFLTTKSWRANAAMIVARDDSHTVDFVRAPKTLVVSGVAAEEIGCVQRYAKRFLEAGKGEEGHGFEWIVVIPEESGSTEWFEWGTDNGVTTWSLESYRAALRNLRDSNPRTKTEPSYSVGWGTSASRDLDDRDLLTDIISWGKDIVIFHDYSRVDSEVRARVEDLYTPVVLLAQQSEAALRKRVEADGTIAIIESDWEADVRAEIAVEVKASIPAPSDDERIALGAAEWLQQNTRRRYDSARGYVTTTLNWRRDLVETAGGYPTPLAHPLFANVTEAEELAQLLADDLTEARTEDLNRLRRWCGVEFEAIEYAPEDTQDMDEAFPLLRNFSHHDFRRDAAYRAEVIAYINSKA